MSDNVVLSSIIKKQAVTFIKHLFKYIMFNFCLAPDQELCFSSFILSLNSRNRVVCPYLCFLHFDALGGHNCLGSLAVLSHSPTGLREVMVRSAEHLRFCAYPEDGTARAVPCSVHTLYVREPEEMGFLIALTVPVLFFNASVWLSG